MTGQDSPRPDVEERDVNQPAWPGWVVPACLAAGLAAVATAWVAMPDGDVPAWLTAITWTVIVLAGVLLGREAIGGPR